MRCPAPAHAEHERDDDRDPQKTNRIVPPVLVSVGCEAMPTPPQKVRAIRSCTASRKTLRTAGLSASAGLALDPRQGGAEPVGLQRAVQAIRLRSHQKPPVRNPTPRAIEQRLHEAAPGRRMPMT